MPNTKRQSSHTFMEQLESQIAKIQLFSPKASSNFVFVMAEKASGSDAEIYMVAELPLFNPAALDQCEQITNAVAGALRRAYKRPLSESSFENAVAQINEELGKLAEMGQNYWFNKFNCILGVKSNNQFTISTCGKTAAYLLRDGQFSDLSTAPAESHPLKTFDSFAVGKIKLGDILILSNTQLLNFVSIDRLKQILQKQNFLTAAQTVIELLKENAGPNFAFGTIFNAQVAPGQTGNEAVDLENYIVVDSAMGNIKSKATAFAKGLVGFFDKNKRLPKADLPKVDNSALKSLNLGNPSKNIFSESLNKIKGASGKILRGTAQGLGDFSGKIKNAGNALSPAQIKQFSPVKKYLTISVVVFVLAACLSVGAAIYNKNVKQKKAVLEARLKNVSQNLNLATSALLYKDSDKAREYFNQAEAELPKKSELFKEQNDEYEKIQNQINDFKNRLENKTQVEAKSLGNLAEAQRLIALNDYLAVQSGKNIISYNKQSGKIEDGVLKAELNIQASFAYKSGSVAIYSDQSLAIWDYTNSHVGDKIISSVPDKEDFVGLAYYPTNSRIYLVDKSKKQIVSFQINKNLLQKPVVAITSQSLGDALDITIDGNIYVLTPSNILKFAAGKPGSINLPFLFDPFSGQGRLYTETGWQYLYLLDTRKNRVIILDKKGNLIKILVNNQLNSIKDFSVDESQRIIYILNNSELFRIDY